MSEGGTAGVVPFYTPGVLANGSSACFLTAALKVTLSIGVELAGVEDCVWLAIGQAGASEASFLLHFPGEVT